MDKLQAGVELSLTALAIVACTSPARQRIALRSSAAVLLRRCTAPCAWRFALSLPKFFLDGLGKWLSGVATIGQHAFDLHQIGGTLIYRFKASLRSVTSAVATTTAMWRLMP